MSLITLAEQLGALAAQANAHIHESDDNVTVSNLCADATLTILATCLGLGWACSAFDQEHNPTEPENIIEDFEPFRVTIQKPHRPDETLDILTSVGLLQWLEKGHDAKQWRIAGLSSPLSTQLRMYSNWTIPTVASTATTVIVSPVTKSPRALVRESGSLKIVPGDIRAWLLLEHSQFDLNEPIHKIWGAKAFDALVHTLANEIDSESNSLVFKGPPKLILQPPNATENIIQNFGIDAFLHLQTAAHWVYENNREAEIKHSLLATEIARSGRDNGSADYYLKAYLPVALESAKIAYQMSLSDLGKDTLKSLGDLRKAITEETAKATDATRQTITAVSGALAVGVGLVAARLSTNINPWLISMVMLIATVYIGMIVYSGWSFISLQRELRREWQPKLYRFLPQDEYKKMVTIPAKKSEKAFKCSAVIGMGAVIIMFVGLSIFSFIGEVSISSSGQTHSKSERNESQSTAFTQLNERFKKVNVPSFTPPSHKDWVSPLSISTESGEIPAKQ
ncbi:hypothetical protein [Pseudomonas fragi]|uniref:hypothetical protein n=1 Tax=Pseudomonas fragi TaxID=296 RepID=UPI001475CF5F|nr:hypothetical protein [Pseudomonas fragi]NNB56177.1 hypothetical protein [Pseudomonas fragi]